MPKKSFASYIQEAPDWWSTSLPEYGQSPASAFLKEAVHLSDAVNHCKRHFPRKKTAKKPSTKRTAKKPFTKDSQDSLNRLCAATLAAIMGHFETYERFLFAGAFEATRLVPGFDMSACCKRLEKAASLSIDVGLLAAYRGQPAPIGQLLADNLVGWHDPQRVNSFFAAVFDNLSLFSNADSDDLLVLWQLRHSIVHSAGWITRPDAQKIKQLHGLGDKPIVLGPTFVVAVARRLHPIVSGATSRLSARLKARLPDDLSQEQRDQVSQLLDVTTPRKSWLKRVSKRRRVAKQRRKKAARKAGRKKVTKTT
jgi:hypothetical protein